MINIQAIKTISHQAFLLFNFPTQYNTSINDPRLKAQFAGCNHHTYKQRGESLLALPRRLGITLPRARSLSLLRRSGRLLFFSFLCFLLFVAVASLSEFVDTLVVNLVLPALVEPDEEDDVVTEGGKSVEPGHLDGEGEKIVDEGVEELVSQRLSGHVGNGLKDKLVSTGIMVRAKELLTLRR